MLPSSFHLFPLFFLSLLFPLSLFYFSSFCYFSILFSILRYLFFSRSLPPVRRREEQGGKAKRGPCPACACRQDNNGIVAFGHVERVCSRWTLITLDAVEVFMSLLNNGKIAQRKWSKTSSNERRTGTCNMNRRTMEERKRPTGTVSEQKLAKTITYMRQ